MRRYTIKECQELTDREMLKLVVLDRRSTLTNPYTPLYSRLTQLINRLEKRRGVGEIFQEWREAYKRAYDYYPKTRIIGVEEE